VLAFFMCRESPIHKAYNTPAIETLMGYSIFKYQGEMNVKELHGPRNKHKNSLELLCAFLGEEEPAFGLTPLGFA
jgi:hypothetical protein